MLLPGWTLLSSLLEHGVDLTHCMGYHKFISADTTKAGWE